MITREPASQALADSLDPMERFEVSAQGESGAAAWQTLMATLFDWRALPSKAGVPGFEGTLSVYHFGFFLLCRTAGAGGRLSRRSAAIAFDDHDHFIVTVVLSGRIGFAGLAGSASRRLSAGDVAIFDLRAPMNCVLSGGDAIHLIVPRLFLPPAVAPPDATAVRLLPAGHVSGQFLAELLQTLARMPDYAGRREAMGLASVLRTPIAFCFGPPETATFDPSRIGGAVRRYIEDNLSRPDLNPATLLQHFAISRSQLFRQFKASGGVETYIRRRRLRRALVALADPLMTHRRIGEIAYDAGFADEAHFGRLFKQAYGSTPRAFRQNAGRRSSEVGASRQLGAVETLALWLGDLQAV